MEDRNKLGTDIRWNCQGTQQLKTELGQPDVEAAKEVQNTWKGGKKCFFNYN